MSAIDLNAIVLHHGKHAPPRNKPATQAKGCARLAKLDDVADAVAALPEIRSQADLTNARVVLQEARAKASAAWDAAWDAAWAAAGARLAPTVVEMQASAQDLVRRMCALKEEADVAATRRCSRTSARNAGLRSARSGA
jgi:hypothetical protein